MLEDPTMLNLFTAAITFTSPVARPIVRTARRASDLVALEPAKVARDALMHRAVKQQIDAFAVMHDHTRRQYLTQQWSAFLTHSRKHAASNPQGELTSFLGHLQRSEPETIYVPQRSFRSLSPGNPYAAAASGQYAAEEVRPTAIALRLMSCRENIAENWVELMPSLAEMSKGRERDAPLPNAAVGECAISGCDKQLLMGLATRLATHQMLREWSLLPSCKHLHDWLSSYVLVEHKDDLTTRGSVERLHANLAAQPMCIRGGALVDPLSLSRELFERSAFILEIIERDLRAAPAHVVPLTSSFLESCLLL